MTRAALDAAAESRRREWQEQRCPRALRLQARVYEAQKVVTEPQAVGMLNNLALYLGGRVERGQEIPPEWENECEDALRRVADGIKR